MATSTPLVSVIIPTYKRPALLLQCITSILRGDYRNYEILVVDQDPSQTLKYRLGQEFADETRLVYLFLDKAGASRARNFGIQHAKGKIVAFIDDDAIADAGWLSAIAELFLTVEPSPALMGGRIDP